MILLSFIILVLWVLWKVTQYVTYKSHDIGHKTVLVTGACSGLGRQICLELARRNAKVIAWDSSKLKLDELKREALPGSREDTTRSGSPPSSTTTGTNFEESFVTMFVDVSSRLQVARAITDISQNLVGKGKGNVDVIINAAHAVPMKPYMEREEESMEKLYQTNLTAALLLARHFLPLMLRRSTGGQYVTVVSETMRNHTRAVDASSADYAASQWALVGQHTSLAAWAQQQHQQLKTEGVVHCTLLYASGAQLSYPTPARGASQTANRTKEEQDLVQAAQSAVRAICARRETHGTTPADAFLNTLWALLPVPWFVRCGWVWGGAAKEKENVKTE